MADSFVPPQDIPLDKVLNLRSQGFTDPQIVEALQRESYRTDQIYNAINQSDLKPAGGLQPPSLAPMTPASAPPPAAPSPPPMNEFASGVEPVFSTNEEKIEELAEAIIDEKWKELTKNIDKIIEWKDKTETRMNEIDRSFGEMKKSFESLHNSILGKVSEYDQNILNLGAEIKAMEKVFQKLLPTFTENVNELSRITTKLKKS
ncbi:MAG: hypothetical protein GXP63_02865 [DPANN group archaeon]|nr:hypothetical protein [DPANN group archaeon]